MTDKEKLEAVLLLLNPSQVQQKKPKTVRTDTRSYISSISDAMLQANINKRWNKKNL